MNEFRMTTDDPRLTGYALGELEGDERQQIEAAVRADPVLQAEVAAIRAWAGRMNDALASEAMAVPTELSAPLANAAIIPGRPDQLDGGPLFADQGKSVGKLLRFSRWYLAAGGLAAACLVLLFSLHSVPHDRGVTVPVANPPKPRLERSGPSAAAKPAHQPSSVEPQVAAQPAAKVTVSEDKPNVTADPGVAAVAPALPASAATAAPAQAAATATTVALPGAAAAPMQSAATQAEPAQSTNETAQAATDLEAFAAAAPVPAAPLAGQPLLKQVERLPNLPKQGFSTPTSRNFAGNGRAEWRDVQRQASRARSPKSDSGAQMLVAANEEPIVLSPFEVQATATGGYLASTTLAGGMRARGGTSRALNTETYRFLKESEFLSARENPLSTFAADVDTASYANVRRFLREGQLPPVDSVRIEELVNYFPYGYSAPGKDGDTSGTPAGGAPFAASLEVAVAPWAPQHRLVRIGLKAKEVAMSQRAPANLVFLLDVSGSMNEPNKLPLVKESMRLLLGRLQPADRVAIVTYAGESGLALASTPVARQREILAAIDQLAAGGSTNSGMGLQLAYDIAKANFVVDGLNRVILCTDGDFNVGVTSEGELVRLVEEKAKSGVFLTVLGFGMGNLKDATLQQIADRGNGSYGYVDTRREAEKLLVEQVNGTLMTVAKDVKLQVEFNPAKVARYRLIGYEKRLLAKEDFNNDRIDAGEIGAGHTVTALYEIIPGGAEDAATDPEVEPLRYTYVSASPSAVQKKASPAHADEWLTLKLRYKQPGGLLSTKVEFPLRDAGGAFAEASEDFRFAGAVAAFGMILRDSPHKGAATLDDVVAWAEAATSSDPGGYRAEFVALAKQARELQQR